MKNIGFSILFFLVFFSASGQDPEFEKGHYYGFDSVKVSGEIAYGFGRDRWCWYRIDEDSPPRLIMTRDAYEFSIRGRRFIAKENRKSNYKVWNEHGQGDFVEVVLEGEVSLYKDYYSDPVARGQHQLNRDKTINYLLERKGGDGILRVSKTKKRFIKELSSYFKGNDRLVKLISKEELGFEDIEYIVNLHNIWSDDSSK